MTMEKGEKNMDTSDTDSMTTVNVNVKDYGNPMDYQEPPPAYRDPKHSTTIQVTKIIAVSAILIAGLLSMSIIFSAWISSASCQQNQQQPSIPVLEALLQPEHLKSFLGGLGEGSSSSSIVVPTDLDQAESKLEDKKDNKRKNKDISISSEDDSGDDENGVTMIKLPLELNLQEHIFERNHRSHMNCVIEKKKAEEIVDEQSKPLPSLLGINMTTDPRYLHFTGEKMAISCDSGNDHKQIPTKMHPPPTPTHNIFPAPASPKRSHFPIIQNFQGGGGRSINNPLEELISSALLAAAGSSSLPVHIIGPIPINQEGSPLPSSENNFQFHRPSQSPQPQIHFFNQIMEQQGPPQFQHQHQPSEHRPFFIRRQPQEPQDDDDQTSESNNNFGPLSALGIPPHLIPILLPQQDDGSNNLEQVSNNPSGPGPIFFHPQSTQIRERALPHPIPIMPRAHMQHGQFVIRPRRSITDDNENKPEDVKKNLNRVKRSCDCDCACRK